MPSPGVRWLPELMIGAPGIEVFCEIFYPVRLSDQRRQK